MAPLFISALLSGYLQNVLYRLLKTSHPMLFFRFLFLSPSLVRDHTILLILRVGVPAVKVLRFYAYAKCVCLSSKVFLFTIFFKIFYISTHCTFEDGVRPDNITFIKKTTVMTCTTVFFSPSRFLNLFHFSMTFHIIFFLP